MSLLDTPNYADTVAYLQKLVAASPRLKLHEFGRSAQGRILYVVIASQEGVATPAALAANGRPTVLAQAGIHAGEIDGKDAGLMLLRDIAGGGKAALLDRANFLFVPIFNVDGHERISEWNRPNQRDHPGEAKKADFLGSDYTDYISPASGVKEVRWLGTPKLFKDLPVVGDKPGVLLRRPKGYYVPVTKPDVIARLKLHGIRMETLPEARTVSVDLYRLANVQVATEPFESHYNLTAEVKGEARTETFPAGSVHISTDQPLGDLAVVMLEPTSRDSLFAWGFFNELLQRTEYIEGYIVAPLAEKMLRDDPMLKADFEAKLAADAKFAADPTARLQWFYERSKFYDQRYLLYPVGIER